DLTPFGAGGCANSYFDVNALFKVGSGATQRTYHTAVPLHIEAMICHKPPGPGESYMNLANQPPIELLDETNGHTQVFIVGEMHTSVIPKETDYFSYSQGKIVLQYPNGQRERIVVAGTTEAQVR